MRNKPRGFNIKQNAEGRIPTKCENCTAHEEDLRADNVIDVCTLPYLKEKFAHKANSTCSIKILNDLVINAGIIDPQLRTDVISKDIVNLQRSGFNPDLLMTKINYEIKLQTGDDILDIRNIDIFAKIINHIKEAILENINKKEIMNLLPRLVAKQINSN